MPGDCILLPGICSHLLIGIKKHLNNNLMDRLAIYFRQHQLKDENNSNINVVVNCGTIATYVPGDVQRPEWINMTNFTEGLENFQSSWDAVNQASSHSEATNAGGSNYGKGLTTDLTFF